MVRGAGAKHLVFYRVNGRGNGFRYFTGFSEEARLIAIGIGGGGGRWGRRIRSGLRMVGGGGGGITWFQVVVETIGCSARCQRCGIVITFITSIHTASIVPVNGIKWSNPWIRCYCRVTDMTYWWLCWWWLLLLVLLVLLLWLEPAPFWTIAGPLWWDTFVWCRKFNALFDAVDINVGIDPDPPGGAVDVDIVAAAVAAAAVDDNDDTPPFTDCPFATICLAWANVGFFVVVTVVVVVVVFVVDDEATWDGVQHKVGPRSRVFSEIGDSNCCCWIRCAMIADETGRSMSPNLSECNNSGVCRICEINSSWLGSSLGSAKCNNCI